jgi:hypothetical protein
VATFSDPNATSSPAASSYTAYISWGDGSASFGQISAGGGASYNISGSHVYPAPGSYSVDVIVTGLGEKGEGAEDIAVVANSGGTSAAPQGMTVTGQTITTGGTTAVSGIAATLNAPASGTYAAAINWGDGTTATAQLSNKGNGQFQITGSHTYAHAGDYMTRIEVGDKSGNLATAFGFVNSPPPTSSMSPLPARETSTKFTVSWSGSDPQGPGIAGYDIYYSDDGSPFAAGLVGTTLTSATFTGQLGHTYAFYSVATDDNGNLQPIPQTAQATTVVVPSDPNGQYVVAVYQDVLGRAPDPGGLQYWTDQLDSGTQISSVAQSIAHSAEYYANFVIRRIGLSRCRTD